MFLHTPTAAMPRGARVLIQRLLRFPLFYKVLIASSVLIVFGVVIGIGIAFELGAPNGMRGGWMTLFFAVTGVMLTIMLNTLLLHAALQPIRTLRGTVSALDHGDFTARVPQSALADADLANVAGMLNQMLDHLQRYQERVQDLSASILHAQEDERYRIARELHDQIGQSLTLLLVRLKILEALPKATMVQGELEELRGAVAATIDHVRRLALDLRPPALDQLGLMLALRALTREFADQTRINVICDLPSMPIEMAPDRATALYRIVQEALTNVAKHAEAHNVRIALVQADHEFVITISDDGHGFDLPSVRRNAGTRDGPGIGLFGMEERTRLLGGTYTMQSWLGAGTMIIATIPTNPLEQTHGAASIAGMQPNDLHSYSPR